MDKLFIILSLCFSAAATDLQPVYGIKDKFSTGTDFDFRKAKPPSEAIAFYAVVTNTWPTGLIPIFAVEMTNYVELRRRPRRGKENATEPLFFAVPPRDEPEATKIAGRWEVEAIRYSGTKDFPIWELAVEGDQVSGRFDQNTDYRFAYLMGGTFRSNAVELRVEYINDSYIIQGTWSVDTMNGRWRRADDSEEGPWQATRPPADVPAKTNLINLYEWRRASDDSRRYAVETEKLGPDWTRARRPLCRVWLAP
ncbi:MAG TPA: hypothetical protein VJ063_04990 [Verrucomicrobiae bacterium]|nr:hypothetical protein [Verrucomicrobiae bacterium]